MLSRCSLYLNVTPIHHLSLLRHIYHVKLIFVKQRSQSWIICLVNGSLKMSYSIHRCSSSFNEVLFLRSSLQALAEGLFGVECRR